jgi:hypothetical protein
MPEEYASRIRQFSLRALLSGFVGVAILLAVWRAFGLQWFLLVFAALSSATATVMALRWWKAYLLSFSVLYGPFVVMAVYATLFVSCSHCKEVAWKLLPIGPGIVPWELGSRLLSLPRFGEIFGFANSFFVSAALVAALTPLIRVCSIWWRVPILVVLAAGSGWSAFAVLSMIRM